jgi:hypothetical protein
MNKLPDLAHKNLDNTVGMEVGSIFMDVSLALEHLKTIAFVRHCTGL